MAGQPKTWTAPFFGDVATIHRAHGDNRGARLRRLGHDTLRGFLPDSFGAVLPNGHREWGTGGV
ncbi:hypothetical protein [uncultured Jannaschia sp.]|uniref:hypothetical protein n=1 Tax=uncultured Jannaschia sp. TaxID=293347 RepID=UPI002612AE13|nr:hypothetical protein [uncultured Jannaschia sp.]